MKLLTSSRAANESEGLQRTQERWQNMKQECKESCSTLVKSVHKMATPDQDDIFIQTDMRRSGELADIK